MPAPAMFTFRDAAAADLPDIVAIYNSTIPSRMVTADLAPVNVAARQAWFDQHNAHRRPIWIAQRDGRCAGWLSFSDWNVRPAYACTAEISIYIHPDFRRQGLGDAFLRRALAAAPGLGVDRLLGVIYAHNTPSVTLFRKHGFVEWGLLPGVTVVDGVRRDVVLLGRTVE